MHEKWMLIIIIVVNYVCMSMSNMIFHDHIGYALSEVVVKDLRNRCACIERVMKFEAKEVCKDCDDWLISYT